MLKLNVIFMSLSSASCLAAFLGAFQGHGIASNQRKLGQKLCLSFFPFLFPSQMCAFLPSLTFTLSVPVGNILMTSLVGLFCPTSVTNLG